MTEECDRLRERTARLEADSENIKLMILQAAVQVEKDTARARETYPDKDETAKQLRELEQAGTQKAREEAERVGEKNDASLQSFHKEMLASIDAVATATEKQNENVMETIKALREEMISKIEDTSTRQTVVSILAVIGMLSGIAGFIFRFAG